MKPATITRMLHSRGVMIVMILAVTAVAVAAFLFGVPVTVLDTNGFVTVCSGSYELPSYIAVGGGLALP